MLISIIIPSYNVRQYLRQCVESVVSQTYKDIEIIIVDDGSIDGTSELADSFASCDEATQEPVTQRSLKVIHKSNGGLSDARNAGLKVAKGEYVAFLDADDYYANPNVLESLFLNLKQYQYPDLLLFCRNDYYENINREHKERPYATKVINSFDDAVDVFRYLVEQQRFNMSACFQIIKRSVLVENNINFVKGLRNEDIDWSIQLWRVVENVKATNIYGYIYRHRSNSITTTLSIDDINSYNYMFDKWCKVLDEKKKSDIIFLQYLAFIFPTIVYHYYFIPRKDRIDAYHKIRIMSNMLRYASTPKAIRVARCIRIIGLRMTTILFGLYGYVVKPIVRYLR